CRCNCCPCDRLVCDSSLRALIKSLLSSPSPQFCHAQRPACARLCCHGIGMTGHSGQIEIRSFALLAACAALLVASALAQEVRPPADVPSQKGGEAATSPPPGSAPDLQRLPAFVDTIGGWLGDSTTRFRLDLQGAQQTFDQLTNQTREAAKDATGAVIG